MDQPGIAVVGEDDRLVCGEQGVEVAVAQAVGMLGAGLEGHQVHDVDDADLEFGDVLAQHFDRGQRFERGDIAGAGHHHVGLAAGIVAGPRPDAEAGGAVLDGGVHVQPLRRGLFAGDDDIDVVAAAQAMVGDGEQGVGVRRQIDADDLGLLVHHVVNEAGVLVAEAVVVLPPHVRGEQVVQGGDGPAPGNVARDLEPLGVLVEHRVHDVDEGFVAGEEAVPAREQIAFQPALAQVLAQHLHHPAVGREVLVGLQDFAGEDAVGRPRSRRPGGWIRFRRGRTRGSCALSAVELHDVAQEGAHDARGLAGDGAGAGHGDGVVPEIGHLEIAQEYAAVGVRVGAHAPLALGGEFGQLGDELAGLVEEFLGLVALHPLLQQLEVLAASRPTPRAAPGASATSLRWACHRLLWGRSSLWACAR